uniref:Ig-like domain-containing protein n=1 Tax=Strongyloides papillosus TaxID=174720 RepID=A0A0N5BTF9_STREA
MSSTLLLPTIASALMLLSNYAQGIGHRKFFPPVFKDITETTFPITATAGNTSDVVIVKCPLKGYQHNIKGDSFEVDESIENSTLMIKNGNKELSWIPLMKESLGSKIFKCGRVNLKKSEFDFKGFEWSYKVKWGNALNAEEITIKERIGTDLSDTHKKCNASRQDTLIFTNMKEGGITKVDPVELHNPYVNQKFYYFVKPNENNKDIIKEPCGITKGYNRAPSIIILNHENLPDELKPGQIKTINTEGTEKTKKNFNVQLQLKNNLNFYRGEKISLTKIRYLEGGSKLIKNSGIIVTSNITIEGYELIKMEYVYEGETTKEVISKMYYFGPSSVDFKIDKADVPYVKGDTTGQPNCSAYYMTVGYLEGIRYNGKKYPKDAPSTNEKFEKSGDFYLLKGNHDSSVFLECIYRTPGGKITTRTNFVVKESEKKIETSSNLNINICNAYNIVLVSSLFIMILRYF